MSEEEKNTEASEHMEGQRVVPPSEAEESGATAPPRSRRPSFGAIRRQLTETELQSPAVQKLLLDMLEEAEASRDEYKSYVEAFHAADKRAAVLGEKLSATRSVDVFFAVGLGLGGAILGLSPFFWGQGTLYGVLCLIVGFGLIGGATAGRLVKR
jgi:hypothetical protein